MKKLLFTIFTVFVLALLSANAQVAIEKSKLTDNVYIGITGIATTPLTFNDVFPVNGGVGLRVGKYFTPIYGMEIEGGVLFNDNDFGRWTDIAPKVTNLGLNGMINFNNLFAGYKGKPRVFEVSLNTGLGWMHYCNTSNNSMTVKTGLDLAFNLGSKRAFSIVLSPGIYWNLYSNGDLQFNKENAQFALAASFVYHFKTSNGTHHFKTYDIGAMNAEIAALNEELAKKPDTVEVVKYVEKVDTVTVTTTTNKNTFVFFSKNSSTLSEDAKNTLKSINASSVSIKAYASPEGNKAYNQKLSERRAAAVKEFLTNNTNVKVNSAEGLGVSGAESGRVAIIIAE